MVASGAPGEDNETSSEMEMGAGAVASVAGGGFWMIDGSFAGTAGGAESCVV